MAQIQFSFSVYINPFELIFLLLDENGFSKRLTVPPYGSPWMYYGIGSLAFGCMLGKRVDDMHAWRMCLMNRQPGNYVPAHFALNLHLLQGWINDMGLLLYIYLYYTHFNYLFIYLAHDRSRIILKCRFVLDYKKKPTNGGESRRVHPPTTSVKSYASIQVF